MKHVHDDNKYAHKIPAYVFNKHFLFSKKKTLPPTELNIASRILMKALFYNVNIRYVHFFVISSVGIWNLPSIVLENLLNHL